MQMHKTGSFKVNRIKRIMAAALMVLLAFSMLPAASYAKNPAGVRIGHAVYGERGSLKGNKAGDRKNREVFIEDWTYSILGGSRYHWKYVLRAKDHELARGIAANMKAICQNNNIGYDQNKPDCATLYDKASANGWDIAGISSKCETTCSNAISVCLNAEGVNVPRQWNTGRMRKDLMNTELFVCLSSKEYVRSYEKLVPGDILVKPDHHAAVVVESDNPFTYTLEYISPDGKKRTEEIKEDSDILINPNNSKNPYTIKMKSDIDLSGEKPELSNYELTGWTKTDSGCFMACYRPKEQTMKLKTEKKKL